MSIFVLSRHFKNDLKSEFIKLPWKKAEQFIYFGGAALQIVGNIICWTGAASTRVVMADGKAANRSKDAGRPTSTSQRKPVGAGLKFSAIVMFAAAILQFIVAMQVKKNTEEFLKRKDLPDDDNDENDENKDKKGDGEKDPKNSSTKDKSSTLESQNTVNSEAELIKTTSRNSNFPPNSNKNALTVKNASITSSAAATGENQEIFDQLHGQHITDGESTFGVAGTRNNSVGINNYQGSNGNNNNIGSQNRRHMRYTQNSIKREMGNNTLSKNMDSVLNKQPLTHMTHLSMQKSAASENEKILTNRPSNSHNQNNGINNSAFDGAPDIRPKNSSGRPPMGGRGSKQIVLQNSDSFAADALEPNPISQARLRYYSTASSQNNPNSNSNSNPAPSVSGSTVSKKPLQGILSNKNSNSQQLNYRNQRNSAQLPNDQKIYQITPINTNQVQVNPQPNNNNNNNNMTNYDSGNKPHLTQVESFQNEAAQLAKLQAVESLRHSLNANRDSINRATADVINRSLNLGGSSSNSKSNNLKNLEKQAISHLDSTKVGQLSQAMNDRPH